MQFENQFSFAPADTVSFRFYISLLKILLPVYKASTQFVTCIRSSFWYTLCCHNKKAYKKTRSWCWGYWNSRIRHGLKITHLL